MQIKLIAPVALAAASPFAQVNANRTGTVSDAIAHHTMQGATAVQCPRECVKQGALVSDGKVYTSTGDQAQFNEFAGKNVVVKGKVSGTTIQWIPSPHRNRR
jgi:hypothetical protein